MNARIHSVIRVLVIGVLEKRLVVGYLWLVKLVMVKAVWSVLLKVMLIEENSKFVNIKGLD